MNFKYVVGHYEWDKFVPYYGFYNKDHAECVLNNLARYKKFHNLVTSVALRNADSTHSLKSYEVVKGRAKIS